MLIVPNEQIKKKKKKKERVTSRQIGVRFISSQKHGLSWLQHDAVQEVDGETADIARVLGVKPEQQLSVIA